MIRHGRTVVLILVAIAAAVALSLAARSHPASQQQRVRHLTSELRCPVCQGLSVADSTSSTSQAIAGDVRARVAAGQSDQAIRSYYVAHYGQWILLNPPGTAGHVASIVPLGLIVGAGVALTVALRRWAASGHNRVPTDADRQLVEQTRRAFSGRAVDLQ